MEVPVHYVMARETGAGIAIFYGISETATPAASDEVTTSTTATLLGNVAICSICLIIFIVDVDSVIF